MPKIKTPSQDALMEYFENNVARLYGPEAQKAIAEALRQDTGAVGAGLRELQRQLGYENEMLPWPVLFTLVSAFMFSMIDEGLSAPHKIALIASAITLSTADEHAIADALQDAPGTGLKQKVLKEEMVVH